MFSNNKDTSHSLISGFILVLVLMVIISLTGLLYLHRHNQSMEHIVTVHNEKTRLLQNMQDAMRERQLSMRDMLIETDVFARDEAWLRHNQAATRFLIAREALGQLDITTAEEIAFKRMREAVTTGGFFQQNLVNAILEGQQRKTLVPAFDKAVNAQQLAFIQLRVLQRIQLEAANKALEEARNNYQFITLLTLLIGTACLIAGGSIAVVVVRKFRHNMQLINEQQIQMENTVDQRTADLRNAVNELEALSYSLAHDLRTPLRAVTGFSQILLQESSSNLNEEEHQKLRRIESAGKYMALLIDDMRTLGRLSRCALDLQDIDLSTLADDVLYELRATSTPGKLEAHIKEGLLTHADPTLMRLVFRNLFDNCLKFATPDSTLKLDFSNSEKEPGTYCVSDNGCGFEAVYAEKIFKPFERLHKAGNGSGTGIGLAIVERVIKRHGGRIWAESRPLEGTSIYFTLGESRAVG